MADPEGFKLGSAWMSVKPNIDQAEWDAKVATALEEAAKGAGVSRSSPLGRGLVKSLEDAKPELVRDADEIGSKVGERIGISSATSIEGGLRESSGKLRAAGDASGDNVGAAFGQALLRKMYPASYGTGQQVGAGIGAGLSKGVEPGIDDADKKIKEGAKKAGQDAGKAAGDAAGQGMSPLIIAALAGSGVIGGSLLLAGLGTAMVGATALVLKGNKVIAADYQKLGTDASTAIKTAAAPLTAELNSALINTDVQVKKLAPDFKSLFSAAEPDIATVTTGLTGFVSGLIPQLSQAVSGSQVIVADFSKSLPVLGSDVGRFFGGLVGNADMQGRALEATLNTLGNTIYSVGSLLGSASTAASPALLGLTHTINGLDDAIRSVGSPPVVGGLVGAFTAMKLDPKVQGGLLSGAEGLSKIADRASESGGMLGKVEGAASGASGTLAKMAGIVGGPWGIAIGAGVGLVSGLIGALSRADDATKAITVSQGDLAASVQQDGAKVGQTTSAYIAQQAQVSGLADEAKSAGVSLELLTQAATGNQSAMTQLTQITGQSNEVSRQQQLATIASLSGQDQLARAQQQTAVATNTLYSSSVQMVSGQNQLNQAFTTGNVRLAQGLVASNSLTTGNQQLLNSVRAQTQQVADAVNKQTALNKATADLNNTSNIFDATLAADYQKLTEKSQVTAQNTVAALNLGAGQSTLNQTLAASVDQYNLASSAASAYGSILTADFGKYQNYSDAVASFTISIKEQSKALTAGKNAMDLSTDAGAHNEQILSGMAKQNYQVAQSLLTQTGSQDKANKALQAGAVQIDQVAKNAGFTKDQIDALNVALYGTKNIGAIKVPISADTGPAKAAVAHLLNDIDSSTGTIQVYSNVHDPAGGKALGAGKAGGGPVTAGSMLPVGEHGQETAVFSQDAYILTHGQTVAMQSRPAPSGAATVNATFNYYGSGQPGTETKAQMMRDLAMAVA